MLGEQLGRGEPRATRDGRTPHRGGQGTVKSIDQLQPSRVPREASPRPEDGARRDTRDGLLRRPCGNPGVDQSRGDGLDNQILIASTLGNICPNLYSLTLPGAHTMPTNVISGRGGVNSLELKAMRRAVRQSLARPRSMVPLACLIVYLFALSLLFSRLSVSLFLSFSLCGRC